MLHVHVEMPDIVSPNSESAEPADTKGLVQKSTGPKQQSMLLAKTAKLILKLLNDLEIDMWCNKTSYYHRFVPPIDSSGSSNDTGYSLQYCKWLIIKKNK